MSTLARRLFVLVLPMTLSACSGEGPTAPSQVASNPAPSTPSVPPPAAKQPVEVAKPSQAEKRPEPTIHQQVAEVKRTDSQSVDTPVSITKQAESAPVSQASPPPSSTPPAAKPPVASSELALAPPKPAPANQREASPPAATNAGGNNEWRSFRGPSGMGTSSAQGLPLTWSLEENVVWKTPLPGPGASSPIVMGERIYLTCFTGYLADEQDEGSLENLKRHLLAFERSSGKLIWNQAVAAKLPEETRIRDHGYAANTPAIDEERIYVFFGKSGVFAFDHEGQQQWQADVGDGTNGWGTASSPVLHKNLVFINASVESQSLIALERATGKEVWRVGGIRESWNTPVVVRAESGREELVVAVAGKVLALDPATGAELWSCKTDIGWYMVPSVVAADGIVYCLGGRSGVAALAVRAGGEGDVTKTHRLWTGLKGSNVTSPVYHEGHLYWMSDSRGLAYCAVAETGEIVYEERLERAGQVYASTLLAEGRLYYLTRDGRTFVLAAKPQFEELAVNELRDRSIFNGSPAVDGSRLLIRSDKFLYCLGK